MPGKRLQHRVRFAFGVHRPGQPGVQIPDRQPHLPGALLDAVPAAPGVLAHEIRHRFQLAQRRRLHRLEFAIVVEHRLQLALAAAHVPDRVGLIQPKVPLLSGVRRLRRQLGKGPRLQGQRQCVKGLPGRMQ